jgi:hypothetical protein
MRFNDFIFTISFSRTLNGTGRTQPIFNINRTSLFMFIYVSRFSAKFLHALFIHSHKKGFKKILIL